MPRSIPKTDFSSIQSAIQDAFNTYWAVRNQREQRGENEKDRQARMQELMMTLQSGRLTAQERNRVELEIEKLRQQTEFKTAATQREAELEKTGMNIAAEAPLKSAMAGYYGRMPQAPGADERERAKTEYRLLLPKIHDEATQSANDLFSDITLLNFKDFSAKHAGWMNEEEFNKIKSQNIAAQSKWAMNKAVDMLSPKYKVLFDGVGIGKEYDMFMEGFKAKWQPSIGTIIENANKGRNRLNIPNVDTKPPWTSEGRGQLGEIGKGLKDWFGQTWEEQGPAVKEEWDKFLKGKRGGATRGF